MRPHINLKKEKEMRKNPLRKSYVFLITGFLFILFAVTAIAAPPRSDFNSTSNNYLVVYESGTAVYGQIVDSIGNPVGSEITISTAMNSGAPSVSYNSNTNQYLVVWRDFRNGNYDVYGQLINANGTLSGNNIEISTATGAQYFPSVVYNVNTNQYLVVWMDSRGGAEWDIYGQLINADDTLAGINFSISTATNNQSNPAIAYNSTANQYLIVWHDDRNGNYDIYGQIVEADGGLSGTNFALTTSINTSGYPSIAYNSLTNQYLVVWQEYVSEYSIRGQFLTSTGLLAGTDFLISNADSPYGVANTIKGNYLIVFNPNPAIRAI